MIIGITGTIGAGKGTVVDYLVKQKQFRHVSARSIWTQELEARGLPIDRDHMTQLANQLRAEHGAAYFMERALASVTKGELVVIESLRAIAEVEPLKKAGGVLLAVDADKHVRFERVTGRGSALDNITFDDFIRQEAAEMENEDPTKQNIGAVMQLADHTIMNEGSVEELHAHIDVWLQTLQ